MLARIYDCEREFSPREYRKERTTRSSSWGRNSSRIALKIIERGGFPKWEDGFVLRDDAA
jgi:hypothetical protein